MPADRAARTATLTAQRRRSAQAKQQQALDAISALQQAGEPLTFTAVHRAAGVSTWFVYNNPTVRAAIEKVMKTPIAVTTPGRADLATSDGLRADLLHARDEIRQLRGERDRLRGRLQKTLGVEIDQLGRRETAERLAQLEQQNTDLAAELHDSRHETSRSTRELLSLREELAGAREAVRRMMRER